MLTKEELYQFAKEVGEEQAKQDQFLKEAHFKNI